MPTQFATGVVHNQDSYLAGKNAAADAFVSLNSLRPDIAFLFCTSGYNYKEVVRGIESVVGKVPIVGCRSAGVFTQSGVLDEGVSLALVSSETHRFFPSLGLNLAKDQLKSVKKASQQLPKKITGFPHHSAMLFLDGLIGRGEETALAVSTILGPMVKLSGGAAADDLKFLDTKVFANNEELNNALSMCLIASKTPVILSVKHGHKPISPPLRVTKAKGSILYELEGRPAMEVWKYSIREAGIDIGSLRSQKEISQLLLKHPAGFQTGNDYKIRFPISSNADGSLNFACSIFEGSVVRIMDSNPHDQIASTRKAAERALEHAKGIDIAGAVVYNCACRGMMLKPTEHFNAAIDEIKKVFKDIPFIGFESYGEIAMEFGELSGFHNGTTVIKLIPR